jgi:hypothetical protein
MLISDSYAGRELCKEYCGDIEGPEEDLFIDALIIGASRFIDNFTHVFWGPSASFVDEQIQSIAGKHSDIFYTRYAPIISVSSLSDDTYVYAENTDFVVFLDDGKVQLKNVIESDSTYRQFSETPGQLKITYVAGQGSARSQFYVKGQSAPEDIQAACAMIVGSWYHARDREGIVSRAKTNENIAFGDSEIPRKAKAILDRRVRWTV